MADQVQIPKLGGGEGAQVPPQPEVKQENAEQTKETAEAPVATQPEVPKQIESAPEPAKDNPEPPTEVRTEEVKQEAPAEAKSEPVINNPEQTNEVKSEQEATVSETKIEAAAEEPKLTTEEKVEANGVAENASAPNEQGDWQKRESELLKKIEELEKVKKERTQDSLLLELKVREEEIDLLKSRVKNLETELQAALSKPSGKNHEMIQNIKQQHEELLSKARGMIFDKTKMVKNQELQIEALNSQVVSLKDINQITKDLLEIRNSEIQAMEDRLKAMEARFKAEKERYALVLTRAQTSSNINDDLRKEYETQLALFKQLREKYDQRVQALVAENERLKASIPQAANGTEPGTSA